MSDDCPEDTQDPDILPRYWGFRCRKVSVKYDKDLYNARLQVHVAIPASGRATTAQPFGEAHNTWHRLDIRF